MDRYMILDFAVLDAPAMFEVLKEFQEKVYVRGLVYSVDSISGLGDRARMKILDVSFDEACEIDVALREADLDVTWIHDEITSTRVT